MAYRITIKTDNAAFDSDNCAAEVARILRELSDRLESRACLPASVNLYDVNGNCIGDAKQGRFK